MTKKWKHAVDIGKVFGALLTDLSKGFDCESVNCKIKCLWPFTFSFKASP